MFAIRFSFSPPYTAPKEDDPVLQMEATPAVPV